MVSHAPAVFWPVAGLLNDGDRRDACPTASFRARHSYRFRGADISAGGALVFALFSFLNAERSSQ
jgi:hypothetical protein